MKKIKITMFLILASLLVAGSALSMDESDAGHDIGNHAGHSMAKSDASEKIIMNHSGHSKTFKHSVVSDGIRADFEVMSLASMNMTDPDGNTHHVMVKLFQENNGDQIKLAVGKLKVITPSKQNQVTGYKDYGGIFAANFTLDENGKYGLISLFKVNGQKTVFKFWYHHMP